MDRRTFLKVAGAAAGGVLAEALGRSPTFGLESSSIEASPELTGGATVDVAVIGGGVAGAYTAWRLTTANDHEIASLRKKIGKHNGKLRIVLYEMSDRIGGRLLSVKPPDMPNSICELGGMRYLTSHPHVTSLVEKILRLEWEPFVADQPDNLVYLRRKRFRRKQFSDPAVPPYDLDKSEQKLDPDELFVKMANRLVPGLAGPHSETELRKLLKEAQINGVPLYRYGLWDLMLRNMSIEAYDMTRAAIGYDAAGWNVNAAELIFSAFDIAPNPSYRRVKQGYERVPEQLAGRFAAAGGRIEMKRHLKAFDMVRRPLGALALTFDGAAEPVYARVLVLAMPKRSLELLDRVGPLFAPGADADIVTSLLESVRSNPLFKLILCYPSPWWQSLGLQQGRSVTDLPIRQVYYWASENKGNSALVIYNDAESVDYWGGMRMDGSPPYATHEQDNPALTADSRLWDKCIAPQDMVRDAARQVREMHGLQSAPDPYAAAFYDWSDDPFGGGSHLWNVGCPSWEMGPKIIQPVKDVPVYIVGEAYSDHQGWVEGALRTSEMLLQQHFGLPRPVWLA